MVMLPEDDGKEIAPSRHVLLAAACLHEQQAARSSGHVRERHEACARNLRQEAEARDYTGEE